jgi:hypothetical protein
MMDNKNLSFGSRYLIFHIKMYIETLRVLQINEGKKDGWNTSLNAHIIAHLVYARALIDFLSFDPNKKVRIFPDDVFAIDYFEDKNSYSPLSNKLLNIQKTRISKRLLHLTINDVPKVTSELEWPLQDIAKELIKELINFMNKVPTEKLYKGIKDESLKILMGFNSTDVPVSLSSTS